MENKRTFGSFFSSDVETLLKNAGNYEKSGQTYELCRKHYQEQKDAGVEMKALFPPLRPNVIFLNHGAFGRTLLETLKLAQMYQQKAESDPCKFYDRDYMPLQCEAQYRMAKFLGCEPTDFVFVQNVTSGIASVLQTLSRTYNPLNVLSLSSNYGQTNKMLWAQKETINVTVIHVDPFSDDDSCIIDSVQMYLSNIHLALFDHVTSQHARVIPIVDLCRMCKSNGIITLVDGAHGLGQLFPSEESPPLPPICDYYVTSCHKWFCGPKGLAILFFDKHAVPPLPPIRSHGINYGTQSEFAWSGLRDYSAPLSIVDTLAFWEVFGPAQIIARNQALCHEASELLSNLWNTKLLGTAGCMACVKLPEAITSLAMKNVVREKMNYDHAEYIQNRLYSNTPKSVQVSIKCHRPAYGEPFLYVRICAHVYNNVDDYLQFGRIVMELPEKAD